MVAANPLRKFKGRQVFLRKNFIFDTAVDVNKYLKDSNSCLMSCHLNLCTFWGKTFLTKEIIMMEIQEEKKSVS